MDETGTTVERPPEPPRPSSLGPSAIEQIEAWFPLELDDAASARRGLEAVWADNIRMYDAIPRIESRDVPIPNAPNYEVPIGAIAADAIYSQAVDMLYAASPIITARAVDPQFVEHAKSLQRFINWGAENEWDMRTALTNALLDDVQLGTSVYYIPWLETRTKKFNSTQIDGHPVIRAIPIEDFFLPGSSPTDLHQARWVALRHWMTYPELLLRSKTARWDIQGVKPCGGRDLLKYRRERSAKTKPSGEAEHQEFEIFTVFASFDVDDDGYLEDILFSFDRTSRKCLRATFNPFDRSRPFESMTYQPRTHLFYGLGVMEMLRAFEEEATEIHNQRVLNMMLANCRMWIAKEGTMGVDEEIWPSKIVLAPDPKSDVMGLQMADIYTSSDRAEAVVISYAERRSGINDLSSPRSANVGTRTPGITALSMLQQVNRRFSPSFDAMRMATGRAARQCLYRYQERLLLGDPLAESTIRSVLGADAQTTIALLKDRNFDRSFAIETTAASATVNRDAERQNAIMLIQMLGQYYTQILQLMQYVGNPQIPEPVQKTAMKIVDAAGEAVDRTIRTFDQVRDPATFIVQLKDAFGETSKEIPEQDITQALQAFGQVAGANGAASPSGQPEEPVV